MKVLIAADEKNYANAILDFVKHHQWPADTSMVVLSVIEPVKVGNAMAVLPGPLLDDIFDANRKAAEEIVESTARTIRQTFKEMHVREVVKEGHAKSEILSYAHNWPADMIVVGSHGKGAMQRMLLGSVSSAVVEHARCSVMVVHLKPPAERPPAQKAESAMQGCKG